MKQICVFCASSEQIDRVYFREAEVFGHTLAEAGCGLIFGGGSVGLMGTLARAVKEAGGRVYGVIPGYLRSGEGRFPHCDEFRITETLTERKNHMIESADGFAILPGGYGTLDEAFEILTLRRHGRLPQPVVLLNTAGFFDSLLVFLRHAESEGFLLGSLVDDIFTTSDPREAASYLAGPKETI